VGNGVMHVCFHPKDPNDTKGFCGWTWSTTVKPTETQKRKLGINVNLAYAADVLHTPIIGDQSPSRSQTSPICPGTGTGPPSPICPGPGTLPTDLPLKGQIFHREAENRLFCRPRGSEKEKSGI